MTFKKKALITGATGVVGMNLLRYLVGKNDWHVVGISRRKPLVEGKFEHIPVDLQDNVATRSALAEQRDVTHVFHAAYVEGETWSETVAPNLLMLKNTMEAIEPVANELEHVHLVQGTKYYGNHLGPFKTPAKESDPRHMPPNFYYDLEDYVTGLQQQGRRWIWSACRPHGVCGFAVGNPMNLSLVLAVYATLSKELGLPLCFPGTVGNYTALYQCTEATHLARAIEWMATEPDCANEAFNITNGDLIRWKNVWPQIAEFFEMKVGPQRHLNLSEMMRDKAPVWDRLVQAHDLQPFPYEEIVAWQYGDFVFTPEFDIISDMTKARRYGFCETVDTEQMFIDLFRQFRSSRVIPP